MSETPRRKSRGAGRIRRIILAVITTVLLVALFAALSVLRLAPQWTDATDMSASARGYDVSQRQVTAYCPARMALSDDASYGDSQYHVSQGNIASSARYAAFGSVYQSSVGALDGNGTQTLLKDVDSQDQTDVKVAAGDADHGARLMDTRLLQAQSGTGSAASIAAWATSGDLKGMSAASCVPTGLQQSFLLPDTSTGTTQQLVVANPSAKATSLRVDVWGSKQTGTMTLSTGRTLNVAAYGESTLDLAAGASDQDALFVTVSSQEAPVAAVVRIVHMDGLTSKGSDFAMPLNSSTKSTTLNGFNKGDSVTLLGFSEANAAVEASWVGGSEGGKPHTAQLTGGKVSAIDLGQAPKDASALRVTSDSALYVAAKVTDSGHDGIEDFGLVDSAPAVASSAIALPDKVGGDVIVGNPSDGMRKATLTAYDADGRQVSDNALKVGAHGVSRLSSKDFSDKAKLFVLSGNAGLQWGIRLSQDDVSNANLPGVAWLGPQPLEPRHAHVRAAASQQIAH
ncbi:MAG: DUF5719 family protein [Bifidobacterium tibiigranuli]|jgi:hypothetical protein|uniref:DUF5719 family protein n=1 Tax=Bifidobacterium tibiigranuli TaxID=2172043 RepID=UPI0026EE7793|nr:DUF5719 family protein [Bifidobacterium tibiigranuli]MCI1673785.1 DUF5719 family protein [Bifidobacterium tibiigranuli]MCI1712034.1 DUF5719 family protein [Bifidobacterium tibiigranuli]MCI1835014.1 DUF5719 family protein [Bifidobacterium tibiigranuli]